MQQRPLMNILCQAIPICIFCTHAVCDLCCSQPQAMRSSAVASSGKIVNYLEKQTIYLDYHYVLFIVVIKLIFIVLHVHDVYDAVRDVTFGCVLRKVSNVRNKQIDTLSEQFIHKRCA